MRMGRPGQRQCEQDLFEELVNVRDGSMLSKKGSTDAANIAARGRNQRARKIANPG
jgi:hypothetical protein